MTIDARFIRRAMIGLAFLGAYIALDYVSYLKPYRGLGVTPWNPTAGLAVAVTFLGGRFYAPFVLTAPLLASLSVRGLSLGTFEEVLLSVGVGSTYLLGGLWLQRRRSFDPRLRSLQDTLTLVFVAVITSALSTALIVSAYLGFGQISSYDLPQITWRGLVGDLIGILVVTPLVLLANAQQTWPKFRTLEALQAGSIILALLIIFGYRDATAFQLFYLLFLPLLWVALKHGPAGAVLALTLIQIGLVVGAEVRFGPDPGLSALQALMTALAITGLVVGSIIAEREDASQRLREQQAAMSRALRLRSAGEIAATIAHEINQPLTTVSTYAGLASQALQTGNMDLLSRSIEKVGSECSRATEILRGIRELLSQGALELAPVSIDQLLGETCGIFKVDLARKNIALDVDTEAGLPPLLADKLQLQQAIHNLVINAADAIVSAGRGGAIRICVRRTDNRSCVVDVSDDGPGFPPGFNTTSPSPFTTTKIDGSGIGLAVVRSVAEAHGGSVTIETSPRGARVSLSVPLVTNNSEAAS